MRSLRPPKPPVDERLRDLLSPPQLRAARDWADSPQGRALRKVARRVTLVLMSRQTNPPPRRTRAAGGGRKPALTEEEIARGRQLFRDALLRNPSLRREAREDHVKRVRGSLRLNRRVGPDPLLRHIIRPVDPRPRAK
jgi:hypothetical protein